MALRDRLIEALGGNGDQPLLERLNAERITVDMLQESLSRLEMQLDEEGWRPISGELEQEFSRGGLDVLTDLSRAMYLSNPLVQRAVNVTTYYVWAQGVSFKANDEKVQKEIVVPLTEDWTNKGELFGAQARLLTEVDQMVDGNVFLGLPTDEQTGDVKVRTIPSNEIREIITMPGDKAVTMFYKREWTEKVLDRNTGRVDNVNKKALYPDWRYWPDNRPESMGEFDVRWDAPVIHRRSGGLKQMLFGVPETYAAIPWARAYKGFLEDWHTIVKSLARFAWKAVAKGKGKAKRTRDKLQSTVPTSGEETNPAPAVGSVWVDPTGQNDLTPLPKTGAHTSADDARPSRLMVAGAMNLPDTILSGDVDVGNFATSKTLDRPTELYMRTRQQLATDMLQEVFAYAVLAKIRYGNMSGSEDTRGDLVITQTSFDPNVMVSFPPILEDDKKANVDAIVAAATLGGRPEAGIMPTELTSRMLLEALEVEDIDKALEELPVPEAEKLAEAISELKEAFGARFGS